MRIENSHVTVTTGSRLHFGPLSYGPTADRQFGGVGLMLDSPGFEIRIAPSERDEIVAADDVAGRVRALLARWRSTKLQRVSNVERGSCHTHQYHSPLTTHHSLGPSFVRVAVKRDIPAHVGLGSGTQFALAVGTGLSALSRTTQPAIDPGEAAVRMGRGRRSALGIHGFARGGFLIDAGKRPGEEIGRLAARCDVPTDWRFLLIDPRPIGPSRCAGLAGKREEAAFAALPAMSAATSGRLSRLALTELLPAVREGDFAAFSQALYEYGVTVGEFFAPVQGGRFSHALAETLVAWLRRKEVRGVAQSSWGPMLAAVLPNADAAAECLRDLQGEERFAGCEWQIASARNVGAKIAGVRGE